MTRTIRGRIGLFTFGVFIALVGLEGGLVLRAFQSALDQVSDRELRADLEELAREVAELRLTAFLERGRDPEIDWGELAFEIRDYLDTELAHLGEAGLVYEIHRSGERLVARSPNLEGRPLPRQGEVTIREGVAFRTEPDPRASRGQVRVAELAFGPYRLQVARPLEPFSTLYATVRTRTLGILIGVSLMAALGAYGVAARALSPVRQLAEEAKRLRTLAEGVLPRSGRGDEIDALAEVLNGLLERVRTEMQRTRQFTADAAHEIRTPLSSIRGHLELLLGEVDTPRQAILSGVLEEVERLSRIVSQLLLLEKLEAQPEAAPGTPFDLGELARDLVDHLRLLAEEQGIELSCQWTATPVVGDPEKLRQVLVNLIDNAFKHTPRGGQVRVRVQHDGARARAVVHDTGPGIAPDRLERVFDRFASDRSRAGAGTGLGLPIARAIARVHGGDLRAASPGGAEFTLELPIG